MAISKRKIRDIVAKIYWLAHSDGRLKGKKPMTDWDFGNASVSIENAIIQLTRPTRKSKKQ